MNHIKHSHSILASAMALIALSACGGGGDGDDSEEASTPHYSQGDIVKVAGSGANAAVKVADIYGTQSMTIAASILQGLAVDTGGSHVLDLRALCSTGTSSANITKSAARTGMGVGDSAVLNFDKCKVSMGASDTVISGTITATAQAASIVQSSSGSLDVAFQARSTGLTVTYQNVTSVVDGVSDVKMKADVRNSHSVSFNVPSGQQWRVVLSGGVITNTVFNAGTAFVSTDTSTGSTRKLDGTVSMGLTAPSDQYTITTPVALTASGSGSSGDDLFVPTSGTMNVRVAGPNIATSFTVNGGTLAVSGDTDRNGSLDLNFSTTWAALIGP